MRLRKYLILIIGIGLVLLIPPFAYIIKFYKSSISDDPVVWGVFGDYIGGLLNPFISLLNVMILGWLTYIVSKQGTEESKRLFILEKRMQAYEELVKHFSEINSMPQRVKDMVDSYLKITHGFNKGSIKEQDPLERFERFYNQLSQALSVYSKLYYILFTFKLKFSHLFEYDFDCEEFQNLIKKVGAIKVRYEDHLKGLLNLEAKKFESGDIDKNTFDLMAKVFDDIRKEVLPR